MTASKTPSSNRRIGFGAAVCIALGLLAVVASIRGISYEVRFATDGQKARALVVKTDYVVKGDKVSVKIFAPVKDREVDLISWRGRPVVGKYLQITYAGNSHVIAREEGTRSYMVPYGSLAVAILLFGIAYVLATGPAQSELVSTPLHPFRGMRRE